MRRREFSGVALLGLGLAAISSGAALAENVTLTWSFRSNHGNAVQLEFYSQSRNHAWPGGGEAYVLDDYDVHTFDLNCRRGEKICYGAWVDGDSSTYWGVGLNDRYGCNDCCVTCSYGDAGTRTLNP